MKKIIAACCLSLLAGCATVEYNGSQKQMVIISKPEVNSVHTVSVGDVLLIHEKAVTEPILTVNQHISGAMFDISAKKYSQIGYDDDNEYYEGIGVISGAFSDQAKAIAISKTDPSELCVIASFGSKDCYRGEFKRSLESKSIYKQALTFNGVINNKLQIAYQESGAEINQPIVNRIEYDLKVSKTINYLNVRLEIISVENNTITYKVLSNFK